MKLKIYFEQVVYADQVHMTIIGEDNNGKRFIVKPIDLVFEAIPEASIHQPTLTMNGMMSREFLPALANGLAESGFRAESNDSSELKATKLHLEDMRKLVFK